MPCLASFNGSYTEQLWDTYKIFLTLQQYTIVC